VHIDNRCRAKSKRYNMAFLFAALGAGWCLSQQPAYAGSRVALIIGNSVYKEAPKLPSPAVDAAAIANLLRLAGFDSVEIKQDATAAEMRSAFRNFESTTHGADIALVYFSGYGVQVRGVDYLVPVDSTLDQQNEVEDETIAVKRVLRVISPAKQFRLVILDACRDYPLPSKTQESLQNRTLGHGIVAADAKTPNTVIVFSATGSAASEDDSGSRHSQLTAALLKHFAAPGVELTKVLENVRHEVVQATNGRQVPFIYGTFGISNLTLVPAAHADPSN
jgi:uncharacterized caspase-like protein